MIVSYNRMPSAHFAEHVRSICIHDEDWVYMSEAIDAKNRAGRLMEYMKQCAEHGDYLSTDVVSYIMTDKDFDHFKLELRERKS